MSMRKLGFILSCMALMVVIAACGGNGNDKIFPCGPSSQCLILEVSDESAPDIIGRIIFDTSVTESQADRLANYIFEGRKELGAPKMDPKFLQIQDGRFVIHQYVETPETEAIAPERKASVEEWVCKTSNEVFDGLSVTSIGHILTSSPSRYSPLELANYALSTEQQSPGWAASCGSGLAKQGETKPASKEAKQKAESVKSTVYWTKETIYPKFLAPDDFPNGWTAKKSGTILDAQNDYLIDYDVKTINITLQTHETEAAAQTAFSTKKTEAQTTIDGRGISGDKFEDVKKYPLFVWNASSQANISGVEKWAVIGVYGNITVKVYHQGSMGAPKKSFAVNIAKKQMDKIMGD